MAESMRRGACEGHARVGRSVRVLRWVVEQPAHVVRHEELRVRRRPMHDGDAEHEHEQDIQQALRQRRLVEPKAVTVDRTVGSAATRSHAHASLHGSELRRCHICTGTGLCAAPSSARPRRRKQPRGFALDWMAQHEPGESGTGVDQTPLSLPAGSSALRGPLWPIQADAAAARVGRPAGALWRAFTE